MSEQQCSDKPLAYLDQNILDLFTEPKCLLKKDSELIKKKKNEVQAVYSPTTLEEIYRSVINGKSSVYGLAFLDVADSSGKCNSIKTSHNFTRCIPT